jgi:hypothetical protein
MNDKAVDGLIEAANRAVIETLTTAEPIWIGMKAAGEVVAGMGPKTILHAGPPIDWGRMCEVQKRGVIGAVLHEGLAKTEDEAADLAKTDQIDIRSALDLNVVGAGVGIVSSSMMVNICQDRKSGSIGFCPPLEGSTGLSAWGVYDEKVEKTLQAIEHTLAPALDSVLTEIGGLETKGIIARGTEMNDESHSRQVAEGALFFREIVPLLIKSGLDRNVLIQCVDLLASVERWFHSLGMASARAILKGASSVEHSSIVTVLAGNGVEAGIKVSALGDVWFTAPAPHLEGVYLSPEWSRKDANPWLGDSSTVETFGLGAFAAAASPIVIQSRGGTVRDAIKRTEEMRAICAGEHRDFPIPLLEGKGPPVGIDICRVMETGVLPIAHGGIIARKGGQIGAGSARFPRACFDKAYKAYAWEYNLGS